MTGQAIFGAADAGGRENVDQERGDHQSASVRQADPAYRAAYAQQQEAIAGLSDEALVAARDRTYQEFQDRQFDADLGESYKVILQARADACADAIAEATGGRPLVLVKPGSQVEVSARTIKAADVEPERVRWLWPARIPLGKLTILDGDPGLGKSTLLADIAARVTLDGPMPDSSRGDVGGPVSVLVLSAEDGAADTIRPRLEAAGADLERVLIWETNVDADGSERLPSLPEDLETLADLIRRHAIALVTVDPLMAYLGARTNSYRDQDVRRALAPLARIGDVTGAAIVLVRHLNKAAGASAVYRGGGSIGIIGAARSGLLVARHPEDDDRRVLASTKSNLGPVPPSLSYRLQGAASGASYVVWEGTTAHRADALVSQAQEDHDRPARDEAADFLRAVLADGPAASKDVLRQAGDAGFNEKTVCRAKKDLGIVARKGGFDAGWIWELPRPEDGQSIPKMDIQKSCPSSRPAVHLRLTWNPAEHPDKCVACTISLQPHELAAGYCEWCRGRGRDRADGVVAS